MRRARLRLAPSTVFIEEIINEAGLANVDARRKQLKMRVGVPPSKYRAASRCAGRQTSCAAVACYSRLSFASISTRAQRCASRLSIIGSFHSPRTASRTRTTRCQRPPIGAASQPSSCDNV